MRTTYSLCGAGLAIAVCLYGVSAAAQQAGAPAAKTEQPPARPGGARTFAPPLVSPQVDPDRRVTFRLRAPNAKEVTVSWEGGGGRKAMTRDERGDWSITVGPLAADLYSYSFTVDGFATIDPANPVVKPSRSMVTSILEVPGDPPRLHEFQDVPHGTVRMHEYRSRSLGRLRGLCVYTPPGYDADSQARYPVLYLLHGAGDNEATWTALGHAHLILDNLLAQRKVKPMVVVMPDGHAAAFSRPAGAVAGQPAGTAPSQPAVAALVRQAGADGPGAGMSRNVAAFERDLLEDVIPFVEASYRVRTDPASRAIAGLSMGGGQSLTIGLNHFDRFAWVGGFSSAVRSPETTFAAALKDPKATDSALRAVWIACGEDDRLITNSQQLSSLLKEKSIHHEFLTTEGNHSWPVWRRYLAEFAPLLFVEKP